MVSGNVTVNVEPFPGSLFRDIVPFSSSTNFFVMFNPKPLPSNFRENPSLTCLKGSKIIT